MFCVLVSDAADADTTVYAKAVRDHFNMLDSTALSFKAGETIIVRNFRMSKTLAYHGREAQNARQGST